MECTCPDKAQVAIQVDICEIPAIIETILGYMFGAGRQYHSFQRSALSESFFPDAFYSIAQCGFTELICPVR